MVTIPNRLIGDWYLDFEITAGFQNLLKWLVLKALKKKINLFFYIAERLTKKNKKMEILIVAIVTSCISIYGTVTLKRFYFLLGYFLFQFLP